jgi:heme/copper-type cytochrome/quinol oxidase subunit 3
VKDTLIANLKKTICKLEEEKHENATKIMKRRKKTNMWCFVGTFVFLFSCCIVGLSKRIIYMNKETKKTVSSREIYFFFFF